MKREVVKCGIIVLLILLVMGGFAFIYLQQNETINQLQEFIKASDEKFLLVQGELKELNAAFDSMTDELTGLSSRIEQLETITSSAEVEGVEEETQEESSKPSEGTSSKETSSQKPTGGGGKDWSGLDMCGSTPTSGGTGGVIDMPPPGSGGAWGH